MLPSLRHWRSVLCRFLLAPLLVAAFAATCRAEPEAVRLQPGSDLPSANRLSWETGDGKSYLIPALEVPAFVVLLNLFDRLAFPNKMKEGKKAYSTNLSTTWEHLRKQNWHFDKDTFEVNQFGHPYEGATFYGLARSSGVSFWQSLIYSNAGSFLWEMAGETSRPSTNDMITTGNAGSLLGEALFRMAALVLEEGGPRPSTRYEVAAALLSPPTGFNRLVFGERFDPVYPSRSPATLWQLSAGGDYEVRAGDDGSDSESHAANAIASFSMAYGLPGKPGYSYRRPLDNFDFLIAGRTRAKNALQAVTVRGLLLGTDYHRGEDLRGIWGVYGSYDYLSPRLFRASSTAVSLGSTAQWWLAPGAALQGSVLGGVGFGVGGAARERQDVEERVNHYGATPQGLLALRLILGDRAALDVGGRGYYITASTLDQLVLTGGAGVTVRLAGNHGVSLRYDEFFWDPRGDRGPERQRSEATVSLVYTFLSDTRLGAVEWREGATK